MKSLKSKQFKLEEIIKEIAALQNEIKALEEEKNKESNKISINNMFIEIDKNNAEIELIKKSKNLDKEYYEKIIFQRESEKAAIMKQINNFEEEIISIKHHNNIHNDSYAGYVKTDDSIKLKEKTLAEIEEKIENLRESNIKNNEKYNSLKESILILKEEKNGIEIMLVNLISLKESLEELIGNINIFERGTEAYEHFVKHLENLTKDTHMDFHIFEMDTIDKSKFIQSLYKYFDSLEIKLNQSIFTKICENCFTLMKNNLFLEMTDFFHLFSKKIQDMLNAELNHFDHKNMINNEKLTLLIRLMLKMHYYDQIINIKLNFLNKESKENKIKFTEESKEVEFQIKTNTIKLDKLEKQREELKIIIAEQLEGSDKKYLKVITKLELKIKELLEIQEELNTEIFEIKSKLDNKLNDYTQKIVILINKNNDLNEYRKGDISEKDNELEKIILSKKKEIAEKFEKIHQYINKSGISSRKNIKLVKDYMEKIQDSISSINFKNLPNNGETLEESNSSYKGNLPKKSNLNPTKLMRVNSTKNFKAREDIFQHEILGRKSSLEQRIDNDCFYGEKSLYFYDNLRIAKRTDNTLNKSNGFSHSSLNKKDCNSKNNSSNNINGAFEDTITKFNYRGKSSYSSSRILDNNKSIDDLKATKTFKPLEPNTSNLRKSESLLSHNKINEISLENSKIESNEITKEKLTQNAKDLLDFSKQKVFFIYEICLPEEFSFLEKIKPMLEGSLIYKRVHLDKKHLFEYNPLENEKESLECFGFSKMFLYLDKSLKKLVFAKLDNHSFLSEILLSSISKIEVPKVTQNIVTLQQIYRKYKKQFKDPEIFFDKIQRIKDSTSQLNENYKYKCLLTTHFSLFILLTTGVKIELLLLSYEDYKNWFEGLSLILKSKPKLPRLKNKIL